jgi:tetratricopeptide (TPR) repeat protein
MKRSVLTILFSILSFTVFTQSSIKKLATNAFYESDDLLEKSNQYKDKMFDSVYPFDPEGYIKRGIEKMLANYPVEALKDIEEAISLAPDCGYCQYLKGINLLILDSIDLAKPSFAKAIELDPLISEASNELAVIYLQEEKVDSAEIVLKNALQYDVNNSITHLHLGTVAFNRGRYGKAKRQYKKTLEIAPCLIEAHAGITMALVYNNQLGAAIHQLEEAILCENTGSDFYFIRGILELFRDRYDKAYDDIGAAVAIEPKNPTYLYFHALICIQLEKYEQAIEHILNANQFYRQLPESRKKSRKRSILNSEAPIDYYGKYRFRMEKNINSLLEEGICHLFVDNLSMARLKFEKALKKSDQPCGPCLYLLAHTSEKTHNWEEALSYYDQLLLLDSELNEVFMNRASIRIRMENYLGAIEDYSLVLNKEKGDTDIHFKRGAALVSMGEYGRAIADFNACLAKDTAHTDALYNRAICYEQIKFYDNAIRDFNALFTNNRLDVYSLYHVALCQYLKEDSASARQTCDTVIALEPRNTEALNLRGVIRLEAEQYEEAITDFTLALKQNPRYEQAILNRYMSYYNLKYYDLALKDIQKLIELQPEVASYYYYRAKLKSIIGDDTACEDLQTALELGLQPGQEEYADICP